MNEVYTDSHAHLELVAARLGITALVEVLRHYSGEESCGHEAGDLNDAGWASRAGTVGTRSRRPARILDIGVDGGDLARRTSAVESAARAERLSPADLPVRWAAGIWPGKEALAAPQSALEALEKDLASGVDALGECGLDYHHMDAPEREQIALFATQVELAQSLGLPLIVHSRDAFADTLRIVAPAAARTPVVIHCFGYGPSEVRAFLAAGCFISFAGNITYKKSEPLRAALALVPPDRLLLETDSPYMNPMPRRSLPSSPVDIGRTYGFVAELLKTEKLALGDTVSKNLAAILGAARTSR